MRRGGDPMGEYYSVLSLEHTCEEMGLSEHNETTRALKQSKKQHFADMYGLGNPDGGMPNAGMNDEGVWEESCCGPCPRGRVRRVPLRARLPRRE